MRSVFMVFQIWGYVALQAILIDIEKEYAENHGSGV